MFRLLEDSRVRAAQLVGATPCEIALTQNTSFGLNAAACALPLRAGDVVLLSDREFPANVYPWLRLAREGVRVELAPCGPEGWPDEEYLLDRVRLPRVRVLAISFVQYASGYRADIRRLGEACRSTDTYFVVDAIQGVGHVPLDLRTVHVDLLACGGQKWLLSPWGTGFLFVRSDLVRMLEPAVTGWMAFEGTDNLHQLAGYDLTLRADAKRFELNTLPFQDFVGLLRSIELLQDVGVDRIAAHGDVLYQFMLRWADERAIEVTSPREACHRAGIFCFRPRDPRAAHAALATAGIVCSLREEALRLSPHLYNTIDEMEKVIEVLENA